MFDKQKSLYLVSNSSGRKSFVWAVSSNQAKRIYCRERGIKANDYWRGVSTLTARKLRPEEVKAWEEQAAAERATGIFVRGTMEISAKAYEEKERCEKMRQRRSRKNRNVCLV